MSSSGKTALMLAALLPCAGAIAEEAREPLSFTVRPSGVEHPDDVRARQERLSRRLDESEFALRSICRNCSPYLDRGASPVPFQPLETLGAGRR
ncbi:MAG: hypothetical protein K0S06_870 [Microvirga sp.]|jgi:hypothetical protein|nr:hypothetical protein [Microvirga sp.]